MNKHQKCNDKTGNNLSDITDKSVFPSMFGTPQTKSLSTIQYIERFGREGVHERVCGQSASAAAERTCCTAGRLFPRAHQRSLRRDAEHDFAWAPDKALDRRGYPAGSVRFG